jgi:glutathione peroxidase
MSVATFLRSLLHGSSTKQEGSFFALTAKGNDGNDIPLSQFEGSVVLVVNTASRCGFTGQYADLQSLYEEYKERKFIILGFPSNDFMGQEPQSDDEIASFCSLNFNVTFPLFAKAPVTGEEIQPVYEFLTQRSPGRFRGRILWNFEKFLIDREGGVIGRWGAPTSPNSRGMRAKIESVL